MPQHLAYRHRSADFHRHISAACPPHPGKIWADIEKQLEAASGQAALVNLGLNLATVQWLGIYGVLLSSVVAIVAVEIPWLFHNLFHEIFPRRYLWPYVCFFCGLVAVALVACAASWLLCSLLRLGVWPSLIVNACVSFLVPNLFFFALFGKKPLFRESIAQIRRVLLKK